MPKFASPIKLEVWSTLKFCVTVLLVTFNVATLPVTMTLLSVLIPVTERVFAKLPEPLTIKSSKPIASNVMLPDTVKSPEIKVLPSISAFP